MAALTSALLIGGASLAGAALSSNASKSAARTNSAAAENAAALQNQQFQQMLALQMPGYNRAEGAAGTYMQALGLGPTGQMRSNGAATVPGSSVAPQGQPAPASTAGMMTGQAVATAQGNAPPWKTGTEDPSAMGVQGGLSGGFAPVREAQAGQATMQPVGQAQPVPAGGAPAGQLDIAGQVMNTPGYQAQLQQGITSIDRAAPLVGGMYSGRRMKALEAHGQNTFGGYYQDWMNRVGGIAGQSQQIAGNIGQQGQQNANNVGNLMMTGAAARAQGQQNSASAWTGALGNIAGMAGGYFK